MLFVSLTWIPPKFGLQSRRRVTHSKPFRSKGYKTAR